MGTVLGSVSYRLALTVPVEYCSQNHSFCNASNIQPCNINKNPTRCNSMQIFIYCKIILQYDFAVNKHLHTVASSWIFINIEL